MKRNWMSLVVLSFALAPSMIAQIEAGPGVDLTGDEVHQNTADTRAYYGKDIPYRTILTGGVPVPPGARHFVAPVNEMFHKGRAHKASR